jgi:hypothetical protein
MTAKPRSRQPAVASSTHSTSPRQSCPQALDTPLRNVQTARPRYPPRSARRLHGPDARHSVRCWIDVPAAPFQSRRHIAGRGRRTRLEHEHHERPQLPHELRKAHTQRAEQGAHCASRLHARRLPGRSPAHGGSDALLHGVDCLSDPTAVKEAPTPLPLDAAVSASSDLTVRGSTSNARSLRPSPPIRTTYRPPLYRRPSVCPTSRQLRPPHPPTRLPGLFS